MKNPCSGFKTEKSLVCEILKKRASWWSYITLIRQHWTLCVGVGKKNGLFNLRCASLCLWVSCVRTRQNNFGCWISPGDKKWYSAAWNWSGSKALPIQTNGTTSPLILVPFRWGACRAGLPAAVAEAHRARGVKPRDESYTELFLKPMCGWKLSLDLFTSQKRLKRVCWRALFCS